MKDFNINNYVKIKLTDEGLKILETQHNEMLKKLTPETAKNIGPFRVPEVDQEGYSQIKLWELMHLFGNYMRNGNLNLPFENIIQIPDQYLVEHAVEKSRIK